MSSLNFAPIDNLLNSSPDPAYDYCELVEALEMDITSYPLLTIILNKLRERYFFKRELVHETISKDFLEFKEHCDESGDYLSHLYSPNIDVVSEIDKLYEQKTIMTPEYINTSKNTDSIVHEIVKRIEKDTEVNFDETLIAMNKLREYQRNLSMKYLEIRGILRERLSEIDKQVKLLDTIKDTFDFDTDDKMLIVSLSVGLLKSYGFKDSPT